MRKHTVEKIGGTSMSRFEYLIDNIFIGDRKPEEYYNRVFVVSAYSGMTNLLLEHKKNGEPGVYALFAAGNKKWEKALEDVLNKMLEINESLIPIGLDIKKANAFIEERIAGISIIEAKNKFLSTPNPFKTLKLESDAHVACLGVNQGTDGAIISIGTGVIGYLIENGKTYRVSGYGFPHSCTGGGAWLGMEAVRLVFDWFDGAIEGSKVLENIFKKFDCDLSKLVQWANSANASEFATAAPFVVKGLEWNDKYSVQLFEKAGIEISGNIKALRKKTENAGNVKCRLMGGLAPFIKNFLNFDDVEIFEDKDAAVKGAIILARSDY